MTLPAPPPPSRAGRTVWGDGSPRPGLAGALVDALAVVAGAGRLLARHWPALLAIFLAGMVLRELIMRAAVRVSFYNAELGMLVLLFAPMTTLTVMVLMLRVVRPSLPWLGRRGRPPSVLVHLGSVLVPFMTIYLFEDDLREDMLDYSYRVWEDFFNQTLNGLGESVDTGAEQPDIPSTLDRLPFDLSLPLAAVVVAAITGRWLLGRWPATERRSWLGLPGAYLELVWITLVMVLAFQAVSDLVVEWSETRRLGSAITRLWEYGVGTASGATSTPEAGVEWLLGQLGQVEAVLIIPLSWLAIGAVVIGRQSQQGSGSGRPVRGREVYDRAQRRWAAAPRAVRWTGERLTEDLRDRFTPLVRGVRLLVRAGAVPMLLFCLAFVAARRLSDWLWQLERALVGPQDTLGVWFPLAWPLSTVNEAIGTAVLICLLAVAVDRALHHSEPRAGEPQPAGAAAEELPVTATVPPAPVWPAAGGNGHLPPAPRIPLPQIPLPPAPPTPVAAPQPHGPLPPAPPPPYGPVPPLPPPDAPRPVTQPTPIRT